MLFEMNSPTHKKCYTRAELYEPQCILNILRHTRIKQCLSLVTYTIQTRH